MSLSDSVVGHADEVAGAADVVSVSSSDSAVSILDPDVSMPEESPGLRWPSISLPSGAMLPVQIKESGEFRFVYRVLLETSGNSACVAYAENKHRTSVLVVNEQTLIEEGECWTILMLQSGYFAAAVFQLCPSASDKERIRNLPKKDAAREPAWPRALLHKRYQHYTTRRKQGGSQSKHDAKGGHAKSMGAQLRRAGEVYLQEDISRLLTDPEWVEAMSRCRRIFIACSKVSRSKLFESGALKKDDRRIGSVPLMTHRPSLAENHRVCCALQETVSCEAASIIAEDPPFDPSAVSNDPIRHPVVYPKPRAPKATPPAPETEVLLSDDVATAAIEVDSSCEDEAPKSKDRKSGRKGRKRGRAARAKASVSTVSHAESDIPAAASHAADGMASDSDEFFAVAIAQAQQEADQLRRVAEENTMRALRHQELIELVDTTAARLRIPGRALSEALGVAEIRSATSSSAYDERFASVTATCRTLTGLVTAGATASHALATVGLEDLAAAALAAAFDSVLDWSQFYRT